MPLKRLALLLVFAMIVPSGVALTQGAPPNSITGYLYERMHRLVLETVSNSIIGSPVKDLDPYFRRHKGHMNNITEVKSALSRDFRAFRQPRLKVLSPDQADAWSARLQAGFIGIGTSFEPATFVDGAVRVTRVLPDTHAHDAGLQAGDFILAVNGEEMKHLSLWDARRKLGGEVGTMLEITVERAGKTRKVSVEVDLDQAIGLDIDFDTQRTKRYFQVERIWEDTPAYEGGLRKGDLVFALNGDSVETMLTDDFVSTVRNGRIGETIKFSILRDMQPAEVQVVRGIVAGAAPGTSSFSQQSGGGHDDHDTDNNRFQFGLYNLDWLKSVEYVDMAVESAQSSPGGILDLRGSSGNDLDVAVKIAARFLNDGRVIRLKVLNGQMPLDLEYRFEKFSVVKATRGKLLKEVEPGVVVTMEVDSEVVIDKVAKKYYTGKLVVLVDRNTSGAAEVLANILQNHHRAVVVGRKSGGVDTLVSVKTVEGVTVQVPTTKIVELDAKPFSRVKPDVSSWFSSGDQKASLDALAGRPWYWSANFISLASVCAAGLLALCMVLWSVYRTPTKIEPESEDPVEQDSDGSQDQDQNQSGSEPEKPTRSLSGTLFALFIIGALVATLFLLPRYMLGPPSGVTSKITVELVRDDSELSKRQVKVVEQLAREYSGAIEFKILNLSDGPDVLTKSSNGFWKNFEVKSPGIWLRREYFRADGTAIDNQRWGSGSGMYTKRSLVDMIESMSKARDYWPATQIKRTKPQGN